jgi:hypothetical protein
VYQIVVDAPLVPIPDWLCDWLEQHGTADKAPTKSTTVPVHPDFDFEAFLAHYGVTVARKRGHWHITDPCPVEGVTHSGNHETGFFYDGQSLGWNCFDSACPGSTMTVGQLIQHLNKPDGLRVMTPYAGPIWSKLDDPAGPAVTFKTPAVSGGDHDYVLGPLAGQTRPPEGHFPLGEVSLIAGSSGAGKSTILYAVAEAQKARQTIYGRATFGRRYLILLHDRSGRDVRITFERLGLDEASVDYHVFDAAERRQRVGEVLTKILEERTPDKRPQVVLIEGLDMAVCGQDKMDRVTPELNLLQDVATHFHIAIIGTVGSPKMKIGEAFANDRDRVFGSIVWSRKSASIWVLVPEGEKRERVKLSMLPRHSSRQEVLLEWQDGQLCEVTKEQLEQEGDKTMLEWVCEQKTFTKVQLKKALKASGSTVNKKLDGLVKSGLVAERCSKGDVWYEVRPTEIGAGM